MLSYACALADLADKYYGDVEGGAAAPAEPDEHADSAHARTRADEAHAALDKARASMKELEGKRKRNPTDEAMLAMLKDSMPLMEAGLNACMQTVAKGKAAGKDGKQSGHASKKAKK